jgi:mannose-6-phosphate isomerase class I
VSYDLNPVIAVTSSDHDCAQGWVEVLQRLGARAPRVLAVECYPGVDVAELRHAIADGLHPELLICAEDALLPCDELDHLLGPYLGDDPVFGFMCPWELEQFYSRAALDAMARQVRDCAGIVVVLGTGASLIAPHADVLAYADMTRWEIQQRQRRGVSPNLGAANAGAPAGELYKRAYFVDWRAADRRRHAIFARIDWYLDCNIPSQPRLVTGALYRESLTVAAHRPFRLVPFFDPGAWGGEWMRRQFGLAREPPNFAWCFACVPEENSLLFGFGTRRLHSPALPLVHQHPLELLGKAVYERFGAEFPIRFDLLDTMQGGNLSLQVHPRDHYMREQFGLHYTQDESYYLLAAQPGAVVYLGLTDSTDPRRFTDDLTHAHNRGSPFPVLRHVNAWTARTHDHFSIPAGTVHCSGSDSVVLEISATPYIFTFKLWDWERLGLDGRPRPIHLEHGIANIEWSRTTDWVRANLIKPARPLAAGPGSRQETTGLHPSQFIETCRDWFTRPVEHDTNGTLNVLNLVHGDQAIIDSPSGAFEPLSMRYAETFVVPAAVGPYRVRPRSTAVGPLATVKAYVR